jgi:hypothetical protein
MLERLSDIESKYQNALEPVNIIKYITINI